MVGRPAKATGRPASAPVGHSRTQRQAGPCEAPGIEQRVDHRGAQRRPRAVPERRRGGGRQRRRFPATRTTTGGGGIILRPLLAAVNPLLLSQPLGVGGRVLPLAHQAARDSAHRPAVEQQPHLVVALLPRVGDGPRCRRGGRGPDALKSERGAHREGTVPTRAQLTKVGGVEQLIGPQPRAVADLEHRVDAARIELRLPVGLRRREQPRTASIARIRCVQSAGDSPAARSW